MFIRDAATALLFIGYLEQNVRGYYDIWNVLNQELFPLKIVCLADRQSSIIFAYNIHIFHYISHCRAKQKDKCCHSDLAYLGCDLKAKISSDF